VALFSALRNFEISAFLLNRVRQEVPDFGEWYSTPARANRIALPIGSDVAHPGVYSSLSLAEAAPNRV
jgi:hypothetical protein